MELILLSESQRDLTAPSKTFPANLNAAPSMRRIVPDLFLTLPANKPASHDGVAAGIRPLAFSRDDDAIPL